ncbi:MAG: AAA family ATPase [Rhodospirillales bacterium]
MTAIASGKGGVGKTWFSVTLAQALAAQHHRVLLFDGDLGLANVDIQLGFTPKHDLGAVLAGRVTLAEAAVPIGGAGFSVLPGRSGSGALASLPGDALATVLGGLATLPYDHVLLDLGAGLDTANRRMAAGADTLLVLVTDEPTSLTDAYAVIKTERSGRPARRRAHRRQPGHRCHVGPADLHDAGPRLLTLPRAHAENWRGIIRRDPHVTDAIRHQTPLLTRHPNSPAAVDVTHIAAALGGRGKARGSAP